MTTTTTAGPRFQTSGAVVLPRRDDAELLAQIEALGR